MRWSQTLSLALNLLAKYSYRVWLPGTLFCGCHGDGSVCGVSRGGLFTQLIKMQEIVMGPIHRLSLTSIQFPISLSLSLTLTLSLSLALILATLIDQEKHSSSSLSFLSLHPFLFLCISPRFSSLMEATAALLSPVWLC